MYCTVLPDTLAACRCKGCFLPASTHSRCLPPRQAIRAHLARRRPPDDPPRLVLWAHNSHLGDARATDMGRRRGELNIGQLMRETFGTAVYNIGWAGGAPRWGGWVRQALERGGAALCSAATAAASALQTTALQTLARLCHWPP